MEMQNLQLHTFNKVDDPVFGTVHCTEVSSAGKNKQGKYKPYY